MPWGWEQPENMVEDATGVNELCEKKFWTGKCKGKFAIEKQLEKVAAQQRKGDWG